jgi:hypothetical protein
MPTSVGCAFGCCGLLNRNTNGVEVTAQLRKDQYERNVDSAYKTNCDRYTKEDMDAKITICNNNSPNAMPEHPARSRTHSLLSSTAVSSDSLGL